MGYYAEQRAPRSRLQKEKKCFPSNVPAAITCLTYVTVADILRCYLIKAKILIVKKLLGISAAHRLNQMCVFNVMKVNLRSWR